VVNIGCVPFGTVETTINCNAWTGTRQNTSAQVKEWKRRALQRRMAQQKSRIHIQFSEPEKLKFSGAEQKTFFTTPYSTDFFRGFAA